MRNKGFTLIEILAVIIVLSIIIAIAIPLVSNSISNAKEKIYKANEVMLLNAAKNYMYTNHLSYPSEIGEILTINLDELKDNNILGDIKDPRDKNISCEGYITIENIDTNQYDYNAYLKCGDNYITEGYIEVNTIPTEGLVLHLDASAIEGLNDGDKVSLWEDLSGNGNDVTQATAGNQPTYKTNILNGNPVVRFDGENDELISPTNGTQLKSFTIFMMKSVNNGLGAWQWANVSRANTPFIYRYRSSTNNIKWYINGNYNITQNITDTSYNVITLRFSAGFWETWVNGDNHKTYVGGVNHQQNALFIWLGQGYHGWAAINLAEVIIYNRALSQTEQEQIELYLGQKWLGW